MADSRYHNPFDFVITAIGFRLTAIGRKEQCLTLGDFTMLRCGLIWLAFLVIASSAVAQDTNWKAGFARVVITPEQPMWMSGYGGRTHESEGKVHDLYARAAALQDASGKRVVMVSLDLVGVPKVMAERVSAAAKAKHKLDRADLMFCCSHTHCGPALDQTLTHMLDMKVEDWQQVMANQKWLDERVTEAIDEAVADLQPARVATGVGNCGFASNRRAPIGTGPIDHEVPVLRVLSADGTQVRGVIFGYACHNTVLGFYQFCGDYAGFAQLYLEERHPGATALFFSGCGADQNPLPRRKVELAEQYGRMLALSVDKVLATEMSPVSGAVRTRFREIPLEFNTIPSRDELLKTAEVTDRYQRTRAKLFLKDIDAGKPLSPTYPYPVQVWKLGNVNWVALGGEVVVDYSLRLKREFGQGQTWVTGYANDVMAYIPSERVLTEGGYEGDTSMIVYMQPSKWKTGLEDQIVKTVQELAKP